jgi:hypothetical protein
MQLEFGISLTVLTLLSPLLGATGAGAVPITYTETTTGTGTLGSTAFTDSAVTVSFAGDTSGVVTLAPGVLLNPAGIASVTVAGLGTATFVGSGVATVDDQTLEGAGIGSEGGGPPSTGQGGPPPLILGTDAPAFATYDLVSAVGPITGPATIDPGAAFPTTSGALVLTAAGNATFTASLAGSAVPEPGSFAVLGASLVGLACWRRAGRSASQRARAA